MIKWLTRMWVSDKPSENHYHYFDDRVLPPHVDADLAHAEGRWYKPEYIINHMNINSDMFATPASSDSSCLLHLCDLGFPLVCT